MSLRQAPRGLGRRDLPEYPHSLSDASGAAKDIVMDKDTVSISGRPWFFKNPAITKYGDTNSSEHYAEAYAMEGRGHATLTRADLPTRRR